MSSPLFYSLKQKIDALLPWSNNATVTIVQNSRIGRVVSQSGDLHLLLEISDL